MHIFIKYYARPREVIFKKNSSGKFGQGIIHFYRQLSFLNFCTHRFIFGHIFTML